MVFQGVKRADAATIGGITDNALYIAMRKPEVLAYLNAQQQVLRTSASARSIARIDTLADDAKSESVKLDANRFLLGIEGISPIAKSENLNVHKGMQPGLTLNLIIKQQPGDDAHLIDSHAHQTGSQRVINGLPRPVPHPSMRNASKTQALPGEMEGQPPATRGAKT